MIWRWASAAVAAVAVLTPAAAAQVTTEAGVQAVFAAQEPEIFTGGIYAGFRTARRARVAVTAGVGSAADEFAIRGELLGHFLLSPASTRRPGLYAGGGVAVVAGPSEQGYVVLLVGVEGSPGGRSGWSLEAGLGGGVRVSAGWRWRSLRRGPPKR